MSNYQSFGNYWGVNSHPHQSSVVETYESCPSLKPGINTCPDIPDVLYSGESGKQGLVNYLSSVYPLARSRFETMTATDLDVFYNSLWFYYNCSYAGTAIVSSKRRVTVGSAVQEKSDQEQICWSGICESQNRIVPSPKSISPLPNKLPNDIPTIATIVRLPYSPTGLFYSWHEWNRDRVPMVVTTCSNTDVSLLGGSIPGQTFISKFMGPAPVWQYARAAYRNIYSLVDDRKALVPGILEGSHDNINPPFPWGGPTSYPNPYSTGGCWRWWHGKTSSRSSPGYIEVNAASEPGIAQSVCPLWFDGWCGSGVFLNLGDTHIARNKSNAVYSLACRVNEKTDWGTDRSSNWGKDRLRTWFGSSEPRVILSNIYQCKNLGRTDGCIADPTGKKFMNPSFDWKGKKIKVDICTPGSFASNSMSLPSQNANDVLSVSRNNKRDWGNKASANDYFKWCGESRSPESCLDEAMFGGSYQADRINTTTVWDEPIFCLASLLEIDTVQMVMSANTSGYWQYEILDMRGSGVIQNPSSEEFKRVDGVLHRDYSSFIEYDSSSDPSQKMNPGQEGYHYNTFNLKYKSSFLNEFMSKSGANLSLRDPFNPDSGPGATCTTGRWSDKSPGKGGVMPNISPAWEGNKTVNLTCQENASRMFANLALTDCLPSCGKNTKC